MKVKAFSIAPERIRRLGNKLGISCGELGVLAGATLGVVGSWEKGKI
jgi:DNA-binding transcriptional regulator YiaG